MNDKRKQISFHRWDCCFLSFRDRLSSLPSHSVFWWWCFDWIYDWPYRTISVNSASHLSSLALALVAKHRQIKVTPTCEKLWATSDDFWRLQPALFAVVLFLLPAAQKSPIVLLFNLYLSANPSKSSDRFSRRHCRRQIESTNLFFPSLSLTFWLWSKRSSKEVLLFCRWRREVTQTHNWTMIVSPPPRRQPLPE